ncbi:MAG: 4Fe-4S binding protein [Ignavibacteria bacterium]|jgi:polyferredoxin|nr:4Fe-4S binding protein [Ignavibacteria bacterium]MCU7504854.1 4Fe-4S binding protein [Ignavibacteria bacterium]MCU7518334.1 4Fe-4S binding protein [Ignavibacteria bacterium]
MAKIIKNTEKPVQKYRFLIQSLFVLLCIWIGIEFYLFTGYLESGGGAGPFYPRPPGVEGFLPISSMMSLYYTIITGHIHYAHPAGLFIFLGIILVSLLFGKAFCSWLCPVGFLSELIGDFGEKITSKLFKKKLRMPKFLDYPLRSLKYLLLGFFAYSIFFIMSELAVKAFLDSPYNIVADIKMYYFFADISRFSLIVIAVLFLLSVFIRNFWCRYLCPYGALLGIISFLSPHKIKRNPVSCIDCGKCARACPSAIKVDKLITVISDECSSCLSCVDACPVADTLELKSVVTKKKFPKKYVAIAIVAVFMIATAIGMLSGHWQNNISRQEYLMLYENMHSFGHPTGAEETRRFNEEAGASHNQEK